MNDGITIVRDPMCCCLHKSQHGKALHLDGRRPPRGCSLVTKGFMIRDMAALTHQVSRMIFLGTSSLLLGNGHAVQKSITSSIGPVQKIRIDD